MGAPEMWSKVRKRERHDVNYNKTHPRKRGKPLKRPNRITNTNETTETRRLKQAKPPKQAKTPNRWKQAWLNYRMQGHSLPCYWITKAAIVICLVQQKVLTCVGPEFYIIIAPQASLIATSTRQLIMIQKSVPTNFWKLNLWLKEHCVSDKSKLQHRTLAYPGRSIPL